MAGWNRGINPNEETVIGMGEARRRLGVCNETVYAWVRNGRLRASKISGRIKTSVEAVDELLQPEAIPLAGGLANKPAHESAEYRRAVRICEQLGV